jgi:dienelactone hydrolase
MKTLFSVIFLISLTTFAQAEIKTQEIKYTAGNANLKGFLAYDESISEKRPGILVVHEWWGHNEYARSRAIKLAKLGYTAFAIDMYGEGKLAEHPSDASKFMQAAFKDFDAASARFDKAKKILQSHKTVDSSRIASIGYCFGGAVSLRMAQRGSDLDGVVAFHGALPIEPDNSKGKITASILVVNGSKDSFLKPEAVASFTQAMFQANADFNYINFAGVAHSYTNPKADEIGKKFNIPNLKYNKEADDRSWLAMQRFFDRIFKN